MSKRKSLTPTASANRKKKLAERRMIDGQIADLQSKIAAAQLKGDIKAETEGLMRVADLEVKRAKIKVNRKPRKNGGGGLF